MYEEKQARAQQELSKGFVTNQLLTEPEARGGLIYSVLDRETHLIKGDCFLPTWDTTDHFHFVCEKCKGVADVLMVKFVSDYSDDIKYALFFYLGCRKCGASGQRKIYLDRRPDACVFQVAYDKGYLYFYGRKDESIKKIELSAPDTSKRKSEMK